VPDFSNISPSARYNGDSGSRKMGPRIDSGGVEGGSEEWSTIESGVCIEDGCGGCDDVRSSSSASSASDKSAKRADGGTYCSLTGGS
jgi:hypothetical protein